MPRLNLRSYDFEFHNDEMNYYENWGIILECNLPKREAFKRHQQIIQGWGFKENKYPKVNGKTIWSFINRVLEVSVGKKFNEVYSKYCRIASRIPDKHYYFMRNFDGYRCYYFIDSDGLIQEKIWWKRTKKKKEPYLFESADFIYAGFHKRTGLPMEIYIHNHQWLRHRTSWEGNFEYRVTSGYQVENVIPKSKLETRLKWEYKQKKKQITKYWEQQRRNKQYSFLTREEEKLKKAKLEDENIKLRHGFGDESFVGAPYHGRKNKIK